MTTEEEYQDFKRSYLLHFKKAYEEGRNLELLVEDIRHDIQENKKKILELKARESRLLILLADVHLEGSKIYE